jgi:hypothetical protein
MTARGHYGVVSSVVRRPSEKLLSLAAMIDSSVDTYLRSLRSVDGAGRWEAPIEGWAISMAMIRHIEGAIALARTDEVMALPATALARMAFEHSVRVCWLLFPSERFDSEARWLAYLEERERYNRYMATEPLLGPAHRHGEIADAVRAFRTGVEARLPRHITRVERVPTVKRMLEELDNAGMYTVYRMTSQPIHGTTHATSSFIQNLGTRKQLGEFVDATDWVLPFRLCWLSLREAGRFVCDRLGVPEDRQPKWDVLSGEFDGALRNLIDSIIGPAGQHVMDG